MNTTLKSIGAVVAGFALVFILSLVTDVVLEMSGVLKKIGSGEANPLWLLAVVAFCRLIYTIGGCYFTADLAPGKPMLHAMVLGCISFAMNILGGIMIWDNTPHWFPVVLVIIALPCAWLAGKIKTLPSTYLTEKL